MATAKISEYANLAQDQSGKVVPVAGEPAIAVQEVTYTSTTASAAFNEQTRFVRIIADAKAHYEFALVPTAAATDAYLPIDTPEYFGVPLNVGMKVAFYDGTT